MTVTQIRPRPLPSATFLFYYSLIAIPFGAIGSVPGGKVNILGGYSKKKKRYIYMYMCHIPIGFRNRAISLYCTLYRRATHHVLTRVAKCIDVNGGNFENVFFYVKRSLEHQIPVIEIVRNIFFLSRVLELYNETSLSRE
jgi:hypothetical protein